MSGARHQLGLPGALLCVVLGASNVVAAESLARNDNSDGESEPAAITPGYIPAPRPVNTGQYLVGALFCPLWNSGKCWSPIAAYPDRQPLLGWYNEGDPEVTDWEIKWSVEHGISFFMVCWYRELGSLNEPQVKPALDHWLEEGLFKSRFGDDFRFAIMWENWNKRFCGETSEADMLHKLLPFWIEHYFKRSNYLVIDNRPVLSIYNVEKFVEVMGSEARARRLCAAMDAACRNAGFDGLYLMGQYCWGNHADLLRQRQQIEQIGIEHTWSYHSPTFTDHYPRHSQKAERGRLLVRAQSEFIREQAPTHLATASMGWDEAPWNMRSSAEQWRLTPQEFKYLCGELKRTVDARRPESLGRRIVLIDNWNEFGEGHYVMPTSQYRFEYLKAIRDVFASDAAIHPPELVPEDIGRGPYDSRYQQWLHQGVASEKN
jgi:hypothetical protein